MALVSPSNMLLRGGRAFVSRQSRASSAPISRQLSTSSSDTTGTIQTTTRLPPVLPPPLQHAAHNNAGANEKPPKGMLERLWDRYSIKGQQHRIHMAESLLQAATRQASDPRWYGPGRIGRDFRPRHALLTMHIWFLHKRLINSDVHDKELALMIQEELFNILWDDTLCRIRQQGVYELMVNKNLLQVQQYTFMHLTHYDHVFSPEFLADPTKRLQELRKLVWYHILVREEEAETTRADQLDRIAWYIEAQYQNIMMHLPEEYFREARIKWVDLPDFSNMVDGDGKPLPDSPVHEDDVLPEPWVKNITVRGVEYFWNEKTRKSSWDRPTM